MKADVDRDVVIQTTQGAVRGHMVDGVAAFKGIPYAAPPFGPHRFRPPQPHAPWPRTRSGSAERAVVSAALSLPIAHNA